MKNIKKVSKWGYGISLTHPKKKQDQLDVDGDFYESRRQARRDQSMKTIDRPIYQAKSEGNSYKMGSFRNVKSNEQY